VRWLFILAILLGACALFSDGPPENVCEDDEDCFRAQGEVCNGETHRCEPGPDAGPALDAGIDTATAR
jgi:hypothetical protein